jgi:NADPH2:quinone reductase
LPALAIARHFGCETIVTSRHQSKLDRARALGADHTVLDAGADWSREVRQITGRRGVDLCVDSIGKSIHGSCIKSLARGGTYATPGCTSGPDATTDLARIFWNQLRILGSTMGSNDEFASLAAMLNAGKLAPVVDKVFPADKGPQAYAHLAASQQMGKVVIDWR